MKEISARLARFTDKTDLLPFMIADLHSLDTDWLAFMCLKTVNCFENNVPFRKRMLRNDSRDYYHTFVAHWFKSWGLMKDNGIWRKRHGLN